MFYYFANLHPKTLKMTDDLANVMSDWAEFNGVDIDQIHSTSNYHVISLNSDLGDYPWDLLDAIQEDYSIGYHSELTPNFFRLMPKSGYAKNQVLGDDYRNWDKYSQSLKSATWDGEP